jgi:hypothetical protein
MRSGPTFHHINASRQQSRPLSVGNLAMQVKGNAEAATPSAFIAKARKSTKFLPAKIPVTRRLLQAWKTDYRAAITDGELSAGVSALFAYHHDQGFFGIRHDGQKLEEGLGPDQDLEIFLAPNRKDGQTESCGCPFCIKSAPVRRVATWRSWQVLPNAYPYAPAHSQHTLLAWEGHREQTTDPNILTDVFAYQRLVGTTERPITMHFNGTAGNSQQHLHWHATREVIPVQEWIDEGIADTEVLRRGPAGDVKTWEKGLFSGILIEGDEAYVAKWGARLTNVVAEDDDTVGKYNLLALPPKQGRARLVIMARRAGDDLPAMGGAWAAGGRAVRYEKKMPEGAEQKYLDAAAQGVVHPDEIEALTPAARAGLECSLLALRLAR